ncbi:uncharacterized protein LOC113140264 isoform X3 [Mastacembelus armatus]|uniref:uncharacterized protein LOC113140264 isoform X3 n=1 Tax=Mastacembelus armatus TaxID=205130 RepID=UPI000E45DD8E|nr:uncharacterized protein LOC113140264 isoform X3 [Mastacembelus armatus]
MIRGDKVPEQRGRTMDGKKEEGTGTSFENQSGNYANQQSPAPWEGPDVCETGFSIVLQVCPQEKMICWIQLLISLTPFTWAGTFVVNVTQCSYQAEENHNITLDWTFTTTAHMSLSAVYIFCELLTEDKTPVLFHLHEGVEVPESQDKQFSGRVQFDKDVLREGRVRLHVSRLRTEDSGLYWCDVKTDDGPSSDKCLLNVTARDWSDPEREPERPDAAGWRWIVLICGLGLTAAAAAAGLTVCYCWFKKTQTGGQDVNLESRGRNETNYSSVSKLEEPVSSTESNQP